MQKEVILCKYGEIVLKGANRKTFEDQLLKSIKYRAKRYGNFEIHRAQSTIYIEPKDDLCDLDGMFEAAQRVFGIVSVSRAAVCEKDLGQILALAESYLPPLLEGKRTFKVEGKRSDKKFPYDSMALAREVGGAVLRACPNIRVDVHNPDTVVKVEIREYGAYLSPGQVKGAGGMPVGTNGKGLVLLSGGIDSPVAAHMRAKRGVQIEALHFESFPYTSERAREKVMDLAALVARYSGNMRVHVVSLTHIQEELVKACDEEYFTLLLRRYMMAIAERVAELNECHALITGESVGQVASQTMQAIGVTNDVIRKIPVFRPCIGMDKEEIVQIARRIGTFETSILPYEDCCTVFTPKHPRTRPELSKVLVEENKLDFNALVEEALSTCTTELIRAEF